MKALLIAIAIIIVLILILVIVSKTCRKLQEEKSNLEIELNKQKANAVYLYEHACEIADIQKSEAEVNHQIEEAKNEEELLNIINSVISTNNDKLRK